MEYLVSKRADMVDAINELKQGNEKTYVFKHRSNNIWFRFDKDLFDQNVSMFYEKIYTNEPQPNPYYVEDTTKVDDVADDNLIELVSEDNEQECDCVEPCEDCQCVQEEPVTENPVQVSVTVQPEDVQPIIQEVVQQVSESSDYVKGLEITIQNLEDEKALLLSQLEKVQNLLDTACKEESHWKNLYNELALRPACDGIQEIKLEDLILEVARRGFDVELKTK